MFRFFLFMEILLVSIGCSKNASTEIKKINVVVPPEVARLIKEEWKKPYDVISVVKYNKYICVEYEALDHHIYYIEGKDGQAMVCERNDNTYSRLDCPRGIPVINIILNELGFTIIDLKCSDKRDNLLEHIVRLYDNPRHYILSRYHRGQLDIGYNQFEIPLLSDMLKSPQDKPELESLFNDSFTINENSWKCCFNVMYNNGSVKQWVVQGSIRSGENVIALENIIVSIIKPVGSYTYPYPFWVPLKIWPD